MTTATLVPPATAVTSARPARTRLLKSEWIKLRSVRSTWILLATTVVMLVGIPAFSAVGAVVDSSPVTAPGGTDVLAAALAGVSSVEFLVAALGALAVTGEYASGLIRVTLTAVPRRLPVLLAKAVVVGTVALVAGVVSILAAYVAVRLVLLPTDIPISGNTSALPVTALGAGAYLGAVALIGMAFGWLVRSTVGALAAFFGFMYLPQLLALLPAAATVAPFVPSNAGAELLRASATEPATAARGGLVLAVWVAALFVVAAQVLRHRDA
jgi:hypothetical protein